MNRVLDAVDLLADQSARLRSQADVIDQAIEELQRLSDEDWTHGLPRREEEPFASVISGLRVLPTEPPVHHDCPMQAVPAPADEPEPEPEDDDEDDEEIVVPVTRKQGRDGLSPDAQLVLSQINGARTISFPQLRTHPDVAALSMRRVKAALTDVVDRGLVTVTGNTSARRWHTTAAEYVPPPVPSAARTSAATIAAADANEFRAQVLAAIRENPAMTRAQVSAAVGYPPDIKLDSALITLRDRKDVTCSMGTYRPAGNRSGLSTLPAGRLTGGVTC